MDAPETKTVIVPIRLSPSMADRFRRAAIRDGRRLSEWLREAGRKASEGDTAGTQNAA
jgi:hypothetical protein